MPLDGLSFSNSGLYKIMTPGEIASQAEQAAQVQAETSIKKTDKLEKTKTDIEDRDEDERHNLEGRDTDDESQNEDDESNPLKNHENIKKYKVKFNQITDMVELVDYKTGLIVETISPQDLISLISKSKNSSGILVDKEI